MKILGISAFYHDSAAALIEDGKILCAVQEERFTRIKNDSSFPINSIKFCLDFASIKINDIDYIAFYEKPFLKFERLIETYIAFAPKGYISFNKAIPLWLKQKLFQKIDIIKSVEVLGRVDDIANKILFSEHHISHAASAFFPSPFRESAILTIDGVGEWATTTVGIGKDNGLELIKEICFPHSLGLLYSAFTYYLGFKVNSGEYKVMGLAPYGVPKYTSVILENLIDIKQDGSFKLNMEYFNYCTGLTMTNEKFHKLFGGKPRSAESFLTQRDMDIASSIQFVLEKVILLLSSSISQETGYKNLCLAGGVALNCVANSKILKSKLFEKIWVQPASGDSGGAIGAALATYYIFRKKPRNIPKSFDMMKGAYLGPKFSYDDIIKRLKGIGAKFIVLNNYNEVVNHTASVLSKEKIVGWFQGMAEFGPRSLGNRAILADPRSQHMQKTLNLKIKFRESFRPFAPSVLAEDAMEWFDLDIESPYMLFVANVLERRNRSKEFSEAQGLDKLKYIDSEIPAITHVDYSARVQTVNKKTNKLFYLLLSEFKKITGCPILVNTSFNVRGEPIVNTPEDAFKCFMNTEMDYLIIGRCLLEKKQQNQTAFTRDINNINPD